MKKFLFAILALCLVCTFVSACSDDDSGVIDMAAMSEIVRSAEMARIMADPENYIGRSFKVRGYYENTFIEEEGKYFHLVIMKDGDSCCPPEGFEFRMASDSGFPELGATLEMVGVLDRHNDLGPTLYYLFVEDMTILD